MQGEILEKKMGYYNCLPVIAIRRDRIGYLLKLLTNVNGNVMLMRLEDYLI